VEPATVYPHGATSSTGTWASYSGDSASYHLGCYAIRCCCCASKVKIRGSENAQKVDGVELKARLITIKVDLKYTCLPGMSESQCTLEWYETGSSGLKGPPGRLVEAYSHMLGQTGPRYDSPVEEMKREIESFQQNRLRCAKGCKPVDLKDNRHLYEDPASGDGEMTAMDSPFVHPAALPDSAFAEFPELDHTGQKRFAPWRVYVMPVMISACDCEAGCGARYVWDSARLEYLFSKTGGAKPSYALESAELELLGGRPSCDKAELEQKKKNLEEQYSKEWQAGEFPILTGSRAEWNGPPAPRSWLAGGGVLR
jgi:hypothetical protein